MAGVSMVNYAEKTMGKRDQHSAHKLSCARSRLEMMRPSFAESSHFRVIASSLPSGFVRLCRCPWTEGIPLVLLDARHPVERLFLS